MSDIFPVDSAGDCTVSMHFVLGDDDDSKCIILDDFYLWCQAPAISHHIVIILRTPLSPESLKPCPYGNGFRWI